MSIHKTFTDTFIDTLFLGTITAIGGFTYGEVDVILGILLKLVSIFSFTVALILGLKKLFKKEKNDRD